MQTLEVIITYKWVRGAAALLAGLALLLIIATGLDASLRELVNGLSSAAAGFATTLQWATDPQHLLAMGALLTLDGVVTFEWKDKGRQKISVYPEAAAVAVAS